MVDHNNPQSRNEEILIATIDGNEYDKAPQSRMEELLLELKEVIEEGGGGGGTTNYENLSNQPQINGETLIGDKTGADLGLVDAVEGKDLSTNDYDDNEKAAVAAATSAISAMKDGTDLDSFGDVEIALLDKADVSDLGTAAAKDSTNAVTAGSTDLVESGAVKDAIDVAVAAAYHHAGTKTVAQLTHDLLIAANEGNVYNITDSGTTTSDFIEGIGKTIDEGSNVGICKVGNTYMFDLLSGFVDTTNFVQKSQTAGLLKNDGTVNDKIEDDVDQLKSGLTNVADDVKLNTQDLTTPSRTKNLLPLTIERIKALNTSGTWSNNTYSVQNGNFELLTDDANNIIGIKVSMSSNAGINCLIKLCEFTNTEILALSGYKVIGGKSSVASIQGITLDYTAFVAKDEGSGDTISYSGEKSVLFRLIISSGNTVNDTFYPMIYSASETDATFAPYIPSVDARLNAVESGLTNVQNRRYAYDISTADAQLETNYTVDLPDGYTRLNTIITGINIYKYSTVYSEKYLAKDTDLDCSVTINSSDKLVYRLIGSLTVGTNTYIRIMIERID